MSALTMAETASALSAVVDALERVNHDIESMTAEKADLLRQLEAVEADERRRALPAKRGDAASTKALAAAAKQRRGIEDALRHLGFALDELQQDAITFAEQKKVAQREHVGAQRAQLAEERLEVAKDIDARFVELVPLLQKWRDLFAAITMQTTILGEPEGRQVHHVTAELLANYLKAFSPGLFSQEDALRHSCFSGLSLRFTSAWPDAADVKKEE